MIEPRDLHLLLKIDGGSEIGMGHVERSLALADHLEAEDLARVGFWTNDAPATILRIQESRFPLVGRGEARFRERVRDREPDGVLFDQSSPLEDRPRDLRDALPDIWLGALDCFDMEIEALDLIVNLFNHASGHERPIDPAARYLEGVEYAIVREDFRELRSGRAHEGTIDEMIVTFGGSDPNGLTTKVLRSLPVDTIPELTVNVIVGPCFDGPEALEAIIDDIPLDVETHEDPENIEELMASADLAIAGAGTTVLELAYLGTPTLVLAQTGQELAFANHLANRGVVHAVGLGRKTAPVDIRTEVHSLAVDADRRQTLSRAAQAAVDGRGRERIAEAIRDGLEEGRP